LKRAKNQASARPGRFHRAGPPSPCGRRIVADSAGERVSEQKAEIAVATVMVTANCRKNWPVMPPRKAVGTKTAQSTSAIETSAPPTSVMVSSAASRGALPPARWCSTFSTTTIASSTTMPTASTSPNSVRLLIEKPSALNAAKVPTSETGMARIGITAARQRCRNRMTTSTTSRTASSIVVISSDTLSAMKPVGS
jgi:hypothetical protein